MKRFTSTMLAMAMGLATTAPTLAQGVDLAGMWRPDQTSDYELSNCGKDNAQLCMKLVSVLPGGGMDKPEVRASLGKFIMENAKRTSSGYKGKLTLGGNEGDATITILGQDKFHIKLCAYVVLCREYDFTRIK